MGLGSQRDGPAVLLPENRLGTEDSASPMTFLDGCEKSLPPCGFDPRPVQPLANRYPSPKRAGL